MNLETWWILIRGFGSILEHVLFNWRWKQLLTELQINEILNSNRGFKNDFWFNSLVLSNWRRNNYIIIMIVWMKNMSEKLNAHHFVAMYANMNVIVVKIWFNGIEIEREYQSLWIIEYDLRNNYNINIYDDVFEWNISKVKM